MFILIITGSGGAVFQGSVQTPLVRADPRHDLRLVIIFYALLVTNLNFIIVKIDQYDTFSKLGCIN